MTRLPDGHTTRVGEEVTLTEEPKELSGALTAGGVQTGIRPTWDDLRRVWLARNFAGPSEKFDFGWAFDEFRKDNEA